MDYSVYIKSLDQSKRQAVKAYLCTEEAKPDSYGESICTSNQYTTTRKDFLLRIKPMDVCL